MILDPTFYPAAVAQVAKFRPTEALDFDDLVQEGVIAAWQATQTPRRDPGTYGRTSARNRVAAVMSGRAPLFGAETGSKTYDPLRRADRRALLEERPDAVAVVEPDLGEEVRAAVRSLPNEQDRRAVHLEYWQGYTRAEIAARLGIATPALNKRWAVRIAPHLREQLEHLAPKEDTA